MYGIQSISKSNFDFLPHRKQFAPYKLTPIKLTDSILQYTYLYSYHQPCPLSYVEIYDVRWTSMSYVLNC